MARLTLSRSVSLAVLASAKTEADHHEDLGCSILGPPSRKVRRALSWLSARIRELGADEARRQAKQLVRALEDTPAYDVLCAGSKRRSGRRVLRDAVLFPQPSKTPPTVLHVRRDELAFDVPVATHEWPELNALFSTLAAGATPTDLARLSKTSAIAREVLNQLKSARWLEPWTQANTGSDVQFVGHNTTLVRGRDASVLIDPYFRPASQFDLPSYQPMQPRDLGPVSAVLITHSHGDHFHLGSLLQLPRETRFFVPPVEQESLFSTDCATRLRQLGFPNVEALEWWSTRQLADLTVQALPFFGEQPTDGEGVHPGLRNIGSTWKVTAKHGSYAFFADAGRDVEGDMTRVCKKAAPIDVLFCGVRGFKLEPVFFGSTTLGAFLVDVPQQALTRSQQLMADGAEALDYAKRLGAHTLVPCADGGAPWYWREGMGPKYPGYPGEPVLGASRLDENPDADPYPERIVRKRGDPKLAILRPGQNLGGDATFPFEWPFGTL